MLSPLRSSLVEARTRGLIGSSAASIGFVILFSYYLSGGSTTPTVSTLLGIVLGLLGLAGFLGGVGALESLSKSFSNRTVVDTYVLALAFGSAASAASDWLNMSGQVSLVPSFGPVGGGLVDGLPALGFTALLGLLLAESVLLFFSFYRIAKLTANPFFALAGTVYGANVIFRNLLSTYLLGFGAVILFFSFLKMRQEVDSQGQKPSWTDVPKGRVGALSSIWFTDDGIFKVKPILASITLLVFFCLYAVSFVGQILFQRYDVNGNLSPETTTQLVFQDAAVFVLLVAFVLLSRYRYPGFSPDTVIRRANERIPWEDVTSIDSKVRKVRGQGVLFPVTVKASGKEYPTLVDGRLIGALDELTQRKLGRTVLPKNEQGTESPPASEGSLPT